MALLSVQHLALLFGLLGNIVSFFVFLAPIPTFYKIYKRKSSDGYQSIPYVVALFSAELLLYYAVIKTNAYLIVCINGFGCAIELVFISMYLFYANKKDKIFTIKLLLLDILFFGAVIIVSLFLVNGSKRIALVGWTCAVINVAVFAAPLSIMRQVIRTRNTQFMPLTLSVCLVFCATAWFFYGLFSKDYYIAFPNILGFLFGLAQIVLYCMYKDSKKEEDGKGAEYKEGIEIQVKNDGRR
ncbi:PREDICTED: bidirectional sugar transporter NEC1-like [Ipomoea nil]|uniref:bidirectional sugar transporter NEC1-like n=1 Tax=Ipomoea nil TaxID=35883 RepID=UPI00090148FA|nr:PREDICTED: bidirectional sugar transporter NEC1-like [Ipomoea nil]